MISLFPLNGKVALSKSQLKSVQISALRANFGNPSTDSEREKSACSNGTKFEPYFADFKQNLMDYLLGNPSARCLLTSEHAVTSSVNRTTAIFVLRKEFPCFEGLII